MDISCERQGFSTYCFDVDKPDRRTSSFGLLNTHSPANSESTSSIIYCNQRMPV